MSTRPEGRRATVQARLQNAPWWAYSLIEGVLFGAWMTVTNHMWNSESWSKAIVSGLIAGVFFGAVMGPLQARRNRKASAVLGNLSGCDRRAAGKAVGRGPVPRDPEIRQVAERLATSQLKEISRTRWLGLPVFSFVLVSSVFSALNETPWWWLGAAVAFAFMALIALLPIHLKRRIKLLQLEASE